MPAPLYKPFPKQLRFHQSTARNRLFGGAAGPGKSHAMRMEIIRLLLSAPGIEGAVFRRTFPELESSIIRPLLSILPVGSYRYNEGKHRLSIDHPDGPPSSVLFSHAQYEKDVYKHQGGEYDFLGFDELTLFNEFQFQFLRGRLRTSKPWVKTTLFATANPGNVGHAFVKRLWIDADRTAEENKESWEFIPATLYDNPILVANDPAYVSRLESLPEDTKKGMLYGDWDAFQGQYFKEWRRDVHVIPAFRIPREWRRIIALDYGYSNPSAVLWLAVDQDRNAYAYRELYVTKHTHGQLIAKIRELTDPEDEGTPVIVADPALQAKSPDTGTSFFEVAKRAGFPIIPGTNDRVIGWNVLREFLKVTEGPRLGGQARLRVFPGCSNLIRTLPALIYDEHKVEDVNTDGEDHAPDALRYGLVHLNRNSGSLADLKGANDPKKSAASPRRNASPGGQAIIAKQF